MFALVTALIVGGGTGFVAERFGFVSNGYIVSIGLGIGGAVTLRFLQGALGIGLGFGRALTSVIGAVALLLLAKFRK